MNILLIPDKFKGSLTAKGVISSLKKGILDFNNSINFHEVIASDGGDGFLDAITENDLIELVEVTSVDSLGRKLKSKYGFDSKKLIAYIELANTSGLSLLSDKIRNVLKTTTYGTGIEIKQAITNGAKKIYIGLGGSATNDGGTGIASALGYQFLNNNGEKIEPIGENLSLIAEVVLPENRLCDQIEFYAVNDVKNPLFGMNGAAKVYAKQKGADAIAIEILDQGLQNLHTIVKNQLGIDAASIAGTGAGGGTAYGLKVFFNAEFIDGAEFILKKNRIFEYLEKGDIDLIITGEGMIDDQTSHGKLVSGVSKIGNKFDIPVIAVCGTKNLVNTNKESFGLTKIIEIADTSKTIEYNMRNASQQIQKSIFNYFKDNFN
ncbi:MAG: glycerate kinase [Flavobacteriaceae bacterium]|nr:glycerate kinase [Flavobacteriaceae bacterium]